MIGGSGNSQKSAQNCAWRKLARLLLN